MGSQKNEIIDIFCKKFLEVEKTPKSFSEILDMDPSVLKSCAVKDVLQLEKLKIRTIRDLSKIKVNEVEDFAQKINIDKTLFKKWVLAANLVARAWNKRSAYMKKEEIKINIMGLDNAGKSTLVDILKGKQLPYTNLNLSPTLGVNVQNFESSNYNMFIWDFGGQISHRMDYLSRPEDYFIDVDLLIYVIDMQDSDRYDESIQYFEEIMDMLLYLEERPYVLILLHKSDPEVVSQSNFMINSDTVYEIFRTTLEEKKFYFEILQTSIYNFYAKEPEYAALLKNLLGNKAGKGSIEDSIYEISEKMNQMMKMITQINNKLQMLSFGEEKLISSQKTIKISENLPSNSKYLQEKKGKPSQLTPPPIKPTKTVRTPQASKQEIMNELKALFALRRVASE